MLRWEKRHSLLHCWQGSVCQTSILNQLSNQLTTSSTRLQLGFVCREAGWMEREWIGWCSCQAQTPAVKDDRPLQYASIPTLCVRLRIYIKIKSNASILGKKAESIFAIPIYDCLL